MSHINIGFDHMVRWDSVLLVIPGGTKMAKRRKEAADAEGKLQDCTNKRGYGSMLLMEDGWVFISHLKPHTLLARASGNLTPPEAEGGGEPEQGEPSPSLPQVDPPSEPVAAALGLPDEAEPKPGRTLLDALSAGDSVD